VSLETPLTYPITTIKLLILELKLGLVMDDNCEEFLKKERVA
jgi:hypothetical protein